MDFGHALAVLKAGGHVRRPTWARGCFLELEPGFCGPFWQWVGADPACWQASHDDLLAEDWIRIDDDTPDPAATDAPPSAGDPGHAAETAPERQQVIQINLSSTLMSDRDLDQFADKIGRRLTHGLPPAGGVMVRR